MPSAVYVYHTHLDVTPRVEQPPTRPVAWHQDSMRVNEEIECPPRPRLSLKVGYYLTDVSGPDWGNALLLPGSHQRDELDCPDDGTANPAGTVALHVLSGSALLLDRRLWHSRSPNSFSDWLMQAEQSGFRELAGFAAGLR